MSSFNKTQLIKDNKQSDANAKSMKNPCGILAIYHSKKWKGATQRMIVDRDDVLEIHNQINENRNDALGRINYEVNKKKDLSSNTDLAYAIISYLPHTQSWKHTIDFPMYDNPSFIINFDADDTGITTRQVLINDFEEWKEQSTRMQIQHQTGSSFMDELITAIPTEMVLSPEQKLERLKEQNRSKGIKQFFYGEEYVWAINQKNADKKAKKLGLKK